MTARNHAFDLLCGICIVRMIVLHVVGVCGERGDAWCGKMLAWSFFFMSFFFFKAGYFNKTVAGDSAAYCLDRFRRLLVPYAVWGTIGTAVFLGLAALDSGLWRAACRAYTWGHVYQMSHFVGNPPVWFLFSFCAAYIVIHFLMKATMGPRRPWRWVILAFPLLSWWLYTQHNPLWLSLSNVPMGIFFFFLGHVWHGVMRRSPRVAVIIAGEVMLIAFMLLNRYCHGEYDMSLNKFDGHALAAIGGNILCLCGLSGVLLSLPLGRVPLFGYIGEHSMVYFVAHYPLLLVYVRLRALCGHSVLRQTDDILLLLLFILAACTALVPLVERVPWLSGRWKRRTAVPFPPQRG